MSGPGDRRRDRERGSTLAELSIAMLVFGLFATFLAITVVQSTKLTRTSALRETAAQTASAVMAQVTKDIRTALRVGPPTGEQVAFVTAEATEVAFVSSIEPDPVRERLYVSGSGLFREVKLPDAGSTYPDLRYTSTDPSRTTTRRLTPASASATAAFRYLLRDSTTLISSVASTSLKDVAAVEVTLTVDSDGAGPVQPVELHSTVRPYNP